MELEVGAIYEGRVTHITKFGAFVSLPEGKSGLVHISELANGFVNDVNDHVHLGDEVKVKLLSVSPEGKINLSIKKALPAPPPSERGEQQRRPYNSAPRPEQGNNSAPRSTQRRENSYENRGSQVVSGPSDNLDFESKLKKFMQDSDSRISGNPLYADRGKKSRRR